MTNSPVASLRPLIFGVVALVAAQTSQANLVIDHFDSPAAGQALTLAAGGILATGNVAASGAFGGTRNIAVAFESGIGNVQVSANDVVNGLNSVLAVTTSARVDGLGGVRYDANGGGLNLNITGFTPGPGLLISDIYGDSTVTFSAIFYSALGTYSGSVSHGPGAGYNLSLPWAAFTAGGSFDPAHVTAIEFYANPLTVGGDVQLGALEIVVPEASTMGWIAGLACVATVVNARRRKA